MLFFKKEKKPDHIQHFKYVCVVFKNKSII